MLEDPSDFYKQPDSRQPEKLILPAPPTQNYAGQYGSQSEYLTHAEQRLIQPGQRIHTKQNAGPPTGPPHTRLAYLWHSDPAYKVLFIAIGVVLVSSIVCVTLLARFVTQLAPPPIQVADSGSPRATPTMLVAPTPEATATQADTSTPIPTPTAVMLATPEPVATAPVVIPSTPNPDGRLTVQIGALPEPINNNTTVLVTVSTNRPGSIVSLSVIYSAIPFLYAAGPQTTDANGNATFSWTIHERTFSPFTRIVTASLTAMARDQDNQQASSPTVVVHILTR